jgi:N-acetylglucosaminyldiphosphoundecaprenol N-acetyl-beta-D-mannosaminyltransferase
MRVDVTTITDASERILSLSGKGKGAVVCVANVHMCMETHDNPSFRAVVNDADLVVPDGKPLVWGQKLLGYREAGHVRGSDLLLSVCGRAEAEGIPIGLYGGTVESLKDFEKFLKTAYPKLSIAYSYSPPFRDLTPEENRVCIDGIRSSEAKILFVGIGCPKQEKWMAGKKDVLPCVMIGVGAAFDFFSGRKKHAPKWMQRAGLEWVFRFTSEPRRLWKRYTLHNPRFIFFFIMQLLRGKA